jgi:hypothetical protein
VRAQDGHRLPVDAQRAQELQLLRLALHGYAGLGCCCSAAGGGGGDPS